MKQTAVQELISDLKNFAKFPMVDQPTLEAAIEFAELALLKEKEQHKDTWFDSRIEMKGYSYMGKEVMFDEYYSKTYNT